MKPLPLMVAARKDEGIDSLIGRFHKMIGGEGIIREYKESLFFIPPCEIKSRKRINKAIKSRRQGKPK